jgi:hypothetical protein
VAIADHARWMMDFLHHHHQAEDTGLWPLIRQRAPQAQGLLDRMQADHAHLTSAAERLRQAAARYRSDAGDQPRADFRDAVPGLSQALLPHLRGEEDEAMPLVAAVPRAIPAGARLSGMCTSWRTWLEIRYDNASGPALRAMKAAVVVPGGLPVRPELIRAPLTRTFRFHRVHLRQVPGIRS